MRKVLMLVLLLTGCASDGRDVLDRIEFDGDEVGCAEIRGVIDLNPLPLVTANASILVKKQKGTGPNVPKCP